MEGKTVIAIAHRLSTIAQLDRLVVIDAGAVIETGTHDELVRNSLIYADLWNRQSGGFLAPEEYEKKPEAAWTMSWDLQEPGFPHLSFSEIITFSNASPD